MVRKQLKSAVLAGPITIPATITGNRDFGNSIMSKIEVDAITEQSGTTLTTGGGAGKTVVVDATTVTLGRCGGTVALASGATQSGFW